ncbi:MAG: MMPL family transporter [Chloroflexi bacterium]|nr:MMPL family transporter [Chloroflexota bacterium]
MRPEEASGADSAAAAFFGRLGETPVTAEIVDAAVAATAATAGRAVFFSGLTVLLGLLGLMLFDFMILRSVGIAGAIVVGLAVAAALTLLPALLSLLGPWIDRFRVRPISAEAGSGGAWARLANRVMDRPVAVLVPTLAFLLVLGAPFLHVRFNAPDSTILPASVPSRQAFDRLRDAFGAGPFAPIVLAVRTGGPATDPENVAALHDYSRRLVADERILRVDSLVDVDPRLTLEQYQLLYGSPGGPPDRFTQEVLKGTTRGDLTAFTITTPYGPNHQDARALVRDLRAEGGQLSAPEGMTVLVGGGAADVEDVVAGVAAEFPRSGIFILVSTYVVLFLLLRSAILPLKALVMNTLSITASFGALVWIFQDGNLSALLGTTPLGFVETTQPVILFCVLFGLSMDYEVFLLSRMQEAWRESGDNRMAVARGLERSGRIVTSAALIVVLVAGSFAFADIVLVKALGLGIAIAVALDATVVRALLVPATMRLLGRWNWWAPAGVLRRVPGLAGGALPLLLATVVVAGCGGAPVLANPPVEPGVRPTEPPLPSPANDPQPIFFPRDDGPHDRLTEWWYYTGHLQAGDGQRFGFEFVVFRAERGGFPVTWASHLAITNETEGTFEYAQRTEVGPQVHRSNQPGDRGKFDIRGVSPLDPSWIAVEPWTINLLGGPDDLVATFESGDGIDLELLSTKPPALHDHDGWVDFGPAGGSYYYSQTRMRATGSITIAGHEFDVDGKAWFDHQWGDFISVGGGGWDWFAINLDDGTDITLSLVRDADGSYPLIYGTLVDGDGATRHLDRDEFTVEATGQWTSPATGARYPAGWTIQLPSEGLTLTLEPTVADQELDTRATTGVVYWEGSNYVTGSRGPRQFVTGEAYVELTGYAP